MRYILIFIIVFSVLLLGATDASANHSSKSKKQDESMSQAINMMLPTDDPNTIYSHYTQMGGKEIRTKTSYFAHCQVWIQTKITKLFADGSPRANPDNTYYPGDGFGYSFSYGWTGSKGCRNFKVCPVESNLISGGSGKCDLEKIKPTRLLKSRPSIGGVGEISTDENASGHFIRLSVAAERYFCIYPKNAKVICGWTMIVATGNYSPSVLKPKIYTMITQEFLKDQDGFVSGNLDKTYYSWDAINLVHNPAYRWKQDRFGTISVAVSKQYDLKLEREFQCNSKHCEYTVIHHGFEPWPRVYEYGGGTTLMNATRLDEHGIHGILYKVGLFNLGRLIHSEENKTDVLVVRYEPKYDAYPYLVLDDGHAFSWGNRNAVALHYLGSEGGGKDDTPGIHEKRRSKINSYIYSGYAFDPIVKTPLAESMLWSTSEPIIDFAKCFDVKIESDSFEKGRTTTAMFVKKGFGKITFSYPILHTMLSKRYDNATIENTLESSGFAGYPIKDLIHYTYQYPDVKFGNPVKILTYSSDGSRTNLPVYVDMVPDLSKPSQYTHDYVCSKIFRDTKQKEFAGIVVGDMYGIENWQNGTGYVNLKTRLTSTWFPEFYKILTPDMLDLELNEGYGAPSPYEITITMGEKTRTIHRIVNFLSPFTHIVNFDLDNTLNVTYESGFARIHPSEKFGEIVRISVDGDDLNKDCTNGCTTLLEPTQQHKIEAWNLWGGRAVAHIGQSNAAENNNAYNWNILVVVIFIVMVGWMLHKFGRQAADYFRNLGS